MKWWNRLKHLVKRVTLCCCKLIPTVRNCNWCRCKHRAIRPPGCLCWTNCLCLWAYPTTCRLCLFVVNILQTEMLKKSVALNGWSERVHIYQNGLADYRSKTVCNNSGSLSQTGYSLLILIHSTKEGLPSKTLTWPPQSRWMAGSRRFLSFVICLILWSKFHYTWFFWMTHCKTWKSTLLARKLYFGR